VDEDKGKDTEESQLDIRQQLAPWFTSKNFLNATQNKAMLKLHGEGDPSSRGEGFSFLRVSMKDIFLRAGEKMEDRLAEIEARPKSAHRYNVAEQQAIYRAEIDRIWKAQFDALSSPYEPMVTEADEIRWRNEERKMEKEQGSAYIPIEAMSPGGGDGDDSDNDGQGSKSASPAAAQAAAKAQAAARAAAVAAANSGPPKVLRIRRLVSLLPKLDWSARQQR
jgi:transcription initiation factor TFIID subunit 1